MVKWLWQPPVPGHTGPSMSVGRFKIPARSPLHAKRSLKRKSPVDTKAPRLRGDETLPDLPHPPSSTAVGTDSLDLEPEPAFFTDKPTGLGRKLGKMLWLGLCSIIMHKVHLAGRPGTFPVL